MKQLIAILGIVLLTSGNSWSITDCPDLTLTADSIGVGKFSYTLGIDASGTAYNNLVSVNWDFDDGVSVTNSSLSIWHQYNYTSSGTYDVTVTARFENGSSDTITCDINVEVSVTDDLPPQTCPVIIFTQVSECPTGVTEFRWTMCEVVVGSSAYWTIESIDWNFGDGQTGVSLGTSWMTHTYSTINSVAVTATAHFIGTNGELCDVEILDVPDAEDACDFVDDPSLFNAGHYGFVPAFTVPGLYVTPSGADFCSGEDFSVYNYGQVIPTPGSYSNWSYELFLDGVSVTSGSGFPDNSSYIYQSSLSAGDYNFEIVNTYLDIAAGLECSISQDVVVTIEDCDTACANCSSFKPIPGSRYWISAWVKEDQASQVLAYTDSHIELSFIGASSSVDFYPTGDIVEGWQRIVGSFTIPIATTDLKIDLINDNASINAYFDDIRVHPFNASMKSYVYDAETYWLTAELDDNNYATFYEYDKEGQLIRIKKETARGIMTIQESRSNNPKSE